jgi:hypothetical protein
MLRTENGLRYGTHSRDEDADTGEDVAHREELPEARLRREVAVSHGRDRHLSR